MRKAVVIGLVIGVFLVTLLVPKTGVEATQFSPPWANRFTFQYDDGYDTTGCDINWEVWTEYYAGYSASYHQNHSVASTWVMSHDAVFSFVGHGEPGYLVFWNGSSQSDLRASDSMSPLPGSTLSYALENVSDLWDLRLMSLVACKSAVIGPPTGGWPPNFGNSLVIQAASKGVDCSLGFLENLQWFPPPFADYYPVYWDNYFYYLLGYHGYTVEDAAELATAYIYYYFGGSSTYFGLDSWIIFGDPSIKIKPAAYGS